MMDYFPNSLDEPALTFLRNSLHELSLRQIPTYELVKQFMRAIYDSPSKQQHNLNIVSGLRIDTFMLEKEITSHNVGLKKLVELIDKKTPICPVKNRTDQDKIQFLRNAVVGFPWATSAIEKSTHGVTWAEFQISRASGL